MDLKDVKILLSHYRSQLKYLKENNDLIYEEDRKQLETHSENLISNREHNTFIQTLKYNK